MTRSIAALLLVLATSGCEPRTRPVVVEHGWGPQATAEVLVHGNSIGTASGEAFRFTAPAWAEDGRGSRACALPPCRGDASASIVLRVKDACGATDYCVSFPQDGYGAPMPSRREPLRATISGIKRPGLDLCTEEVYRLWIDNREGDETELRLGQSWSFRIPRGAKVETVAPVPACEGEAELVLHGRSLGAVPLLPPSRDAGGVPVGFLVDVSGRRCYVQQLHQYGIAVEAAEPRRLVRDELHALGWEIDDFLRSSPESVEVMTWKGAGGMARRVDLLETPCPDEVPAPSDNP